MEKQDFSELINKAVLHFNNKEFQETVLILEPNGGNDVAIDFFLSISFFNLKNYEKCVFYGRGITAHKLNNIDSFVELQTKNAIANMKLNRLKDAEGCMEKLLEIKRQVTNIYYDIGKLYYEIGKDEFTPDYVEDAIRCYKNELMINPDFYTVYNSLGCCYWRINKFELSKACFRKCVEMEPGHNEARKNLAVSYFDLKEYEKSKEVFEESLKYEPNNSIILYAMSNLYLKLRNYRKGFSLYEHRFYKNMKKEMHSCIPKISGVPLWDEVTEHNRLLVIWEQGLGDMVQFYRYVLKLKQKYPNTEMDYIVPQRLTHLFKEYPGINVIGDFKKNVKYGAYVYLMTIPKILEVDKIESVTENYINVNSNKLEYWTNQMRPLKRLKVGLFWRGNNITKIQKHIPLSAFRDILELDIDFISLQKGKGEEEASNMQNLIEYQIDNEAPFIDSVAILKNLDLLITVDTSIVHFAGTLGVKTWMILGDVSEWRWFLDEKKTDWYDSVELFRNTTVDSWEPVLNNIKKALEDRYLK
tara:strand:- start:17 stop:1600 length:1584 start_codon:yes stop_codon:yes gene_type:complete